MRRGLGLDKTGKREAAQGLRAPTPDEVSRRLRELREYRWSSYTVAEPFGLRRRMEWPDLMKAVADVVGERSERSLMRRGAEGKPLLLWAARRYGGMTLREAGEAVGGMDYTAVAMAVKRLEQRAGRDRALRRLMKHVEAKCEM
jgi:hypothetical protein